MNPYPKEEPRCVPEIAGPLRPECCSRSTTWSLERSPLADLPRLRYLRLPDIEINAQLIETLSMLPNLKTLDLTNDPSEDALKLLGDLPKLEEVLVDSLLPEMIDFD